jgi:NAD(P)-dependent dehydrogenase (short-subunit alcohol dehydrogenase family)
MSSLMRVRYPAGQVRETEAHEIRSRAMDLQLAGKRAVVTGGSRGIGKAVARQLLLEGVDVVIAARTPERLRGTAEELAAAGGGRVTALEVDTGDDDSVADLFARAADVLGGLDILVNSAARPSGQAPNPKIGDITTTSFFEDVNVKVMGAVRCVRHAAPLMKASGWGRIVNVDGLGARQTGNPLTSMRNAALAAFTKNAADELGRFGINVTVVHPGYVDTEATPAVLAARAEAAGTTVDEIRRQLGGAYAIGRYCTADEVATVITFLCSPRSVALAGDPVVASGGVRGPIHY